MNLLTAPILYSLLVPLALLDERFVAFGDAEGFHRDLPALRADWADLDRRRRRARASGRRPPAVIVGAWEKSRSPTEKSPGSGGSFRPTGADPWGEGGPRLASCASMPARRIAAAMWSDGERTRSRDGEMAVVLARIAGEYREMPGLRLTESQAQRLWNLDEPTCRSALKALVEAGLLTRFASGAFGVAPSL